MVGMVDDMRRAFRMCDVDPISSACSRRCGGHSGWASTGAPGADGNCNCNMCPYMALNTLEKLYVALRDLQPRIELSPEVMDRARIPLERMLEMAGRTVGQGDVGKPILPIVDHPEEIDPAISGD